MDHRQARWAKEFAGYGFKTYFRPGKQNEKADCLSRRPEHRLENGVDNLRISYATNFVERILLE